MKESNLEKKPKKSICFKLKNDDNNITYDISILYVENILFFKVISEDVFSNKKKYENSYSIEDVRKNEYFNLLEKLEDEDDIDDVYDEIDTFIKQHKIDTIKIFEKDNKLIINFPLDSLKKCQFELINNEEQKFNDIWLKLNELEKKAKKSEEENFLLKMQLNELIEANKKLKEQIEKKNKIQSGEYFFDFWSIDSHYMYSNEGDRSSVKHINFKEKYEEIPKVMVSLNGLDTEKDQNLRIKVSANNIDEAGFDLLVETWAASAVYRVKVSWISYG